MWEQFHYVCCAVSSHLCLLCACRNFLMYQVLWKRPALKPTLKILRDYFTRINGVHELWPEQNGNLSWGKPKSNFMGSRAQEDYYYYYYYYYFKNPNEVLCHFLCSNRVMICDWFINSYIIFGRFYICFTQLIQFLEILNSHVKTMFYNSITE